MTSEHHLNGGVPNPAPRPGVSRRDLFGLAGAGAAGAVIGAGTTAGFVATTAQPSPTTLTYPFHGPHQAGVTTPVQDHLHFAALDLAPSATREDLADLLAEWTAAAERITQGLEVGPHGASGVSPLAPPDDTGEALGLDPNGLTITFGFGPTLFETADGTDRYRLASRRPAELTQLPRFSGDALDPARGGGDLCIQACANDPQVAVHAIRNLVRIAAGRAVVRWTQLGFGRTSSTSTRQKTARNLLGFKDGTNNLKAEDAAAINEDVWVPQGPGWLAGGTYLIARRIRMHIEVWDRTRLEEQERVIGRNKIEGAPLSGGTEFTEVDFEAKGAAGQPLLDIDSHVRLAHPAHVGGARILRRGYNYTEHEDALGLLDAGLFFLSFQRTPQQFIDIQTHLAGDALNEYIKHVGSAVFAVPPGSMAGEPVGTALFA